MNKNLVLAIALSFLIMVTWSRITQKLYPVDTQDVTTEISQHQPLSQAAPLPVVSQQTTAQDQVTVSAKTNNQELVFNLPSASLRKVVFTQMNDHELLLETGFCLADKNLVFEQQQLGPEQAIFVHEDAQIKITKRFDYSEPASGITLDIEIENLSEQPLAFQTDLVLASMDLNSKGLESRFKEIFVKQPDKIVRLSPGKATKFAYEGDFFGFRERYFCAIIMPMSFPEKLQIIRSSRTQSQLILSRPTVQLPVQQSAHLQYRIYLGPQQAEPLRAFYNGAEAIIYYGVFDPIAKLLLQILYFFSRLFHNWGWAIIALSIFIFFIVFPLSAKQMRSARDMQALQPKIEELRSLYKDNPQRLNKEVLELYRRHKINPLGGCLPLVLQIPIFFSLYQALIRSIELKGAHFLWIKDLSEPDRFIASPEINILPILMAITMFLQQKFTMMPGTGSSGEQQKLMSLLFPILFGFIFYRMPSGLVMYWFVNSLLMFVYQRKMKVTHESAKH
ncbi:membrane protein insertase YidC [Candidatus Omnitrophota bacterium]